MTVLDVIEYIIDLKGGAHAAGEAHKLRGALGGVKDEIGHIGKESPKAAAGTTMLGSSFKKMAGGIIAAGLAYKAYSAAKNALTFTDELVHSTTTLSGATKLSTQEASRWIGVAEALGVHSTAVTTGFARLAGEARRQTEAGEKQTAGHHKQSIALETLLLKQRAALQNARETASHQKNQVSAQQKIHNLERSQMIARVALSLKEESTTKGRANAFDILNISQKELTKTGHNMGALMTLVVKKLQAVHDPTARGAALTKLFGRSYAELGPLLLGGSEKLEKMLNTARKFGVEIKESGSKGLEEYHERLLETKLATEGLQLRFSELAIGPIKRLQEGFLAVANALRTGKWDQVEKQTARLTEAFAKIASHVLPVLAGSFAKMGPILLKALWTGFINAPLGGKAVLAATLFYKLGFAKDIFAGKGGEMGRAFGAAFVIAAVAAAAAAAHAALSGAAAITQLLGAGADAEAAELKDPLVRKTREHNRYLETHPKAKEAVERKYAHEHPHTKFSEYFVPGDFPSRAAAEAQYNRLYHRRMNERISSPHPSPTHGVHGESRDIVINVDGRQLMRVTRRQQMQAQAQSAG